MASEQASSLPPSPRTPGNRWLIWGNLLLTAVLLIGGIWYLVTQVSLRQLGTSLAQANSGYILLSLLTILATLVIKAWRWQIMYPPPQKTPTFDNTFWTFMLGLYVNQILPLLRLGEVVRIVELNRQAQISKARTVGTLVIEKLLELITLGATVLILISLVILPDSVEGEVPNFLLTALGILVLIALFLVASNTDWIQQQAIKLAGWLPAALKTRYENLVVYGLQGLAALRDRRRTFALLFSSAVIGVLSVMTSFLLFPAFHLPFGLAEAAAIHIFVSIALVPPSTPAKIGVFDGVVAFLLFQFGLENEATLASYTIVFHLVVILPQIVLGWVAASRSSWRLSHASGPTAVSGEESS